MKKSILLVTKGNFPYGGASANLLRLFSIGLACLGNDIKVILPSGHYFGNEYVTKRNDIINEVKYRYLCCKNHPKNIFGGAIDSICGSMLLFIYIVVQHFYKTIDLLIVYNTSFTNTTLLLLIKIILNKKMIIILPEYYEKPKTKIFSHSIFKWLNFYIGIKYFVKYADGFIVLTTFLENYLTEGLRSKKKVLVMPNLVDPSLFNLSGVKSFKQGLTTIGYSGTPTQKDGVLDLLKAFSILNQKYPETHLLIIGDLKNNRTTIPKLMQYANSLKIDNSVTFTGLVSYGQIPELLHSCQILALTRPSGVFAEAGFPTKLGEYFVCRKPVVITAIGDIPKYFINEKHVVIVEPGNIESIVHGFERIINNVDISEKLSANAYLWMEENLNYRTVSVKVDNFLNSFINKRI